MKPFDGLDDEGDKGSPRLSQHALWKIISCLKVHTMGRPDKKKYYLVQYRGRPSILKKA